MSAALNAASFRWDDMRNAASHTFRSYVRLIPMRKRPYCIDAVCSIRSPEPAMITAHTDVVGSLLRPVALRRARDDLVAGRLTHAQFKSIEDRAVDEAVSLQEAAGLEIVTDGEMRRLSFQSAMTEAVDGFGAWDIDAFLWGHWHGGGARGEQRRDRPVDLGVVSRLVRKRHLVAEEFVYLRRRTSRIAKLTLPSPS